VAAEESGLAHEFIGLEKEKVFVIVAYPECGKRLRAIAFIAQAAAALRTLDHLGVVSQGSPMAKARAPPDAAPGQPTTSATAAPEADRPEPLVPAKSAPDAR